MSRAQNRVSFSKLFHVSRYVQFQAFVHYYFVAKLLFKHEPYFQRFHMLLCFSLMTLYTNLTTPNAWNWKPELCRSHTYTNTAHTEQRGLYHYAYTWWYHSRGAYSGILIFLTKTWALPSLYSTAYNKLKYARRVNDTKKD